MPIEIREFIVKIKVVEDKNPTNVKANTNTKGITGLTNTIKREIIQECVEKVLEKLVRMREK